jgi:ubiquinone/menaquinone biosynthesis C-methylase UbiE
MGYLLASPIRRLQLSPARLLSPHVAPGMTVLDIGCAMGFLTLPAARLVGPEGRVIAVDLQPRMLETLRRRARRSGLSERIEARACDAVSLGIDDLEGSVDVALAIAVIHEVPDAGTAFAELCQALRPGGRLLFVEPAGHVSRAELEESVDAARSTGLEVVSPLEVRRSHAMVLRRPAGSADRDS